MSVHVNELEELEQSVQKCVKKIIVQDVKPAGKGGDVVGEILQKEKKDEDFLRQDILDAISLLSKGMHLLDYMSDVELCKSVTKRERDSMARLSEKIHQFLDEVENVYIPSDVEED